MLKKIAIAVVLLVAGVLGYATTKPDTFRVERSLSMHAPADEIYPLINDLHQHVQWSPWDKMDPQMKRSYSGAEAGKGAVYEWEGNSQVGQGRMEIVETVAPAKVVMDMHFIKPMEGRDVVEFNLQPEGERTNVSWSIAGPMPYISKVISVFCDMDAMIGKEFDKGLGSLKAIVEK